MVPNAYEEIQVEVWLMMRSGSSVIRDVGVDAVSMVLNCIIVNAILVGLRGICYCYICRKQFKCHGSLIYIFWVIGFSNFLINHFNRLIDQYFDQKHSMFWSMLWSMFWSMFWSTFWSIFWSMFWPMFWSMFWSVPSYNVYKTYWPMFWSITSFNVLINNIAQCFDQ